jgi:hypothetical protein
LAIKARGGKQSKKREGEELKNTRGRKGTKKPVGEQKKKKTERGT